MEFDPLILDRLVLRRAAISQLSGEQIDSLDKLVAERQQKMRERRDRRITWLAERLDELDRDA